jgi:carboxylesterase
VRRGALLVHGFTGSPFEMRLCGEALAARGLFVDGPELAGHSGMTGALAATGWPEWLATVEAAFDALRARCDRVGVVGMSLGGLLALELARRRGSQIAALAVLSAPLTLGRAALAFDRVLRRLPPWARRAALPKLAGSDISDPEMRRRNAIAQGRAGMPLGALHSLIELGARLRAPGALAEVRAPTLLMHSRQDHTVPFACLSEIAGRLGAPIVRTQALDRSFHVITLDVEREQVFRAVGDHLLEHL